MLKLRYLQETAKLWYILDWTLTGRSHSFLCLNCKQWNTQGLILNFLPTPRLGPWGGDAKASEGYAGASQHRVAAEKRLACIRSGSGPDLSDGRRISWATSPRPSHSQSLLFLSCISLLWLFWGRPKAPRSRRRYQVLRTWSACRLLGAPSWSFLSWLWPQAQNRGFSKDGSATRHLGNGWPACPGPS